MATEGVYTRRLTVIQPSTETPDFVSRPTDVSALAGDDILLSCQATGDPHPDIHWTRKDSDRVDINKVGGLNFPQK